MSYTISFSDQVNNGTITVEDSVINTETSMQLTGKGALGYGEAYAQNFLHLLENFSNRLPPDSPVQGQLWYDSTDGVRELKIYDGINWIPASGIRKSANTPSNSKTGDLWVNTRTQQLFLYSGSAWVLVGPDFQNGQASGAKVETIVSSTDVEQSVMSVFLLGQRVAIFSSSAFSPKRSIIGFSSIKPGINLTTSIPLKFWGVSEKAESLIVDDEVITASNFLRSDVESTTNYAFNVKNNNGLSVGANKQFTFRVENNNAVMQHNVNGASIDFRTRDNSVISTVLSVTADRRVGINNRTPQYELDIGGSIQISPLTSDQTSGILKITSQVDSTTLNNGSIVTAGGAAISKNLIVGGGIAVSGVLRTRDILPADTELHDIGSPDLIYSGVYARDIFAENIVASVVNADISGNATTAGKLQVPTTFAISGDISSEGFSFDGSVGGTTKTFTTAVANTFISSKDLVTDVGNLDELLISVNVGGVPSLKRASKLSFLKSLPSLEVGIMMPYGGDTAPAGWLLCDGREVTKAQYPLLWAVIGHKFKPVGSMTNPSSTHFGIPDARGRGLIGVDSMGGTPANRVSDGAAQVGGTGGTDTVDIYASNLPNHRHTLRGTSGTQFYALNQDSQPPVDDDATTIPLNPGITGVQALNNSGGILNGGESGIGDYREITDGLGNITDELGAPINTMNPFIAVNYIIYAG